MYQSEAPTSIPEILLMNLIRRNLKEFFNQQSCFCQKILWGDKKVMGKSRYIFITIYLSLCLPCSCSRWFYPRERSTEVITSICNKSNEQQKIPLARNGIHVTSNLTTQKRFESSESNAEKRELNFNLKKVSASMNFMVLRNTAIAFLQSVKSKPYQSAPFAAIATGTFSVIFIRSLIQGRPKVNTGPIMAPTNSFLRAFAFWRRAGPILVHYKFTQSWFKIRKHPFEKRDKIWNKIHNKHAPEVYNIITEFRGVFVKMGQVLSSRPDFMPRQYIALLSTFQDALPPKPFDEIRIMVEESIRETDENLSFDDVFDSFDEKPIGTASIGQVR